MPLNKEAKLNHLFILFFHFLVSSLSQLLSILQLSPFVFFFFFFFFIFFFFSFSLLSKIFSFLFLFPCFSFLFTGIIWKDSSQLILLHPHLGNMTSAFILKPKTNRSAKSCSNKQVTSMFIVSYNNWKLVNVDRNIVGTWLCTFNSQFTCK